MEAGQGHVVTDILQEAAPSKQEGPSGSKVINMHTLSAGWAFIYPLTLRDYEERLLKLYSELLIQENRLDS